MSDQYKQPYTKFILSDVQSGLLDTQMVQSIQRTFASEPGRDPAYLDSLNEALEYLLGPTQIVERQRDREGQHPDSEVK